MHKISKGSRFNQIYIPRKMEGVFEVGDLVSIRLVKKNVQLFYSKNIKLSNFKENLIRGVFSFLSEFKEIEQIFMVGSFITQKIDYRDIDLLIVIKGKDNYLESKIYNKLVDKFNLKFHLILIPEDRMARLLEICPLTRSMLCCYISNKKFQIPKSKIDGKHIKFLLMMPDDLLRINAGSRVFYDNIRRLITIERFLNNKELNPEEVTQELKNVLGNLFEYLKNNELLDNHVVDKLRKIIKIKLKGINKKL